MHRPLALLLRTGREAAALGFVCVVLLLRVATFDVTFVEVSAPAARVVAAPVRVLVELEHAVDGAIEERTVVGDDHDPARELGEERLEQVEAGEVEVVRRFVEQEHVETREQDRCERGARGLAAGHRGHRHVEQTLRESDTLDGRGGAHVEVGRAEREVLLECVRVFVVGARAACAQRFGGSIERRDRVGHARAPAEKGAQGLAGATIRLLRKEADGRRRWQPRHRAAIRDVEAGEQPQQRALPGPVGRDDADAAAGRHRDRDRVEHDARPERLRDFTSDEGCGRRLRHGRTSGAARAEHARDGRR